MGVYHYFDGFSSSNWLEHAASGTAYSYGTPFQVNATKYVTKLGWYRKTAGISRLPTHIGLWDTTTTAEVWGTDSVQDDGAVGWQWTTLPNPVAIVANREYRVAIRQPATNYYTDYTPGSTQTPPSPIFAGANYRCYVQSGNVVYPNSADNQRYEAVDVEVDDTGTGGLTPPALSGDITNALTAWFADTGDNTHRYNATVPNIADVVRYRLGDAQGQTGSDLSTYLAGVGSDVGTILTNVGDILTSVGAGLGAAVATVQDTLSHASTGMVDVLNGVSSVVDDILNNASTGLVKVLNYLGGGGGALPPRSAVPATGWANVATTAFTDDIAWTQPADMYVVTFSDVGANDTTTLVSGLDIVYRLAWWLPLNATQLQGERRFIDAPLVELTDGGKRMPGLALHCPKGGAGTIDAWQYTP